MRATAFDQTLLHNIMRSLPFFLYSRVCVRVQHSFNPFPWTALVVCAATPAAIWTRFNFIHPRLATTYVPEGRGTKFIAHFYYREHMCEHGTCRASEPILPTGKSPKTRTKERRKNG